jgi:hypothetical protein
LRWDFGFTCPFCLLHEADFVPTGFGAEGYGVTQIEHWHPKSTEEGRGKVDVYEALFYICRFCNRSKWAKPVEAGGVELLDPTVDAWSQHFRVDKDELTTLDGDSRAERTRNVYDLDDPRKTRLRGRRREVIEDRLLALRELPSRLERLLDAAQSEPDGMRAALLLEAARGVQRDLKNAFLDVARYKAVPEDADATCRCDAAREIPEALSVQLVDVAEIDVG